MDLNTCYIPLSEINKTTLKSIDAQSSNQMNAHIKLDKEFLCLSYTYSDLLCDIDDVMDVILKVRFIRLI